MAVAPGGGKFAGVPRAVCERQLFTLDDRRVVDVPGPVPPQLVIPDDLVGRLEGKSSLARLGLLIHSTAGFVDAGFDGYLTLELSNVATLPITLYPGMKIGQISFFRLSAPAETPYGSRGSRSKYQGQRGPTASRFFEEFGEADPPS